MIAKSVEEPRGRATRDRSPTTFGTVLVTSAEEPHGRATGCRSLTTFGTACERKGSSALQSVPAIVKSVEEPRDRTTGGRSLTTFGTVLATSVEEPHGRATGSRSLTTFGTGYERKGSSALQSARHRRQCTDEMNAARLLYFGRGSSRMGVMRRLVTAGPWRLIDAESFTARATASASRNSLLPLSVMSRKQDIQ